MNKKTNEDTLSTEDLRTALKKATIIIGEKAIYQALQKLECEIENFKNKSNNK